MLVERRRSAFPVEFLARVGLAWAFVAAVLTAVNWPAVSKSLTLSLETASLVVVPLAILGCAMMLTARIAWRLLGDEEATLAALIPALSIPVLFELAPLRIDHHGWQILCALAALNALTSRSPAIGGWTIGASCAIWLAISPEGLPFTLAMIGVLFLRWQRNHKEHGWMVSGMQALTGVSAALFLFASAIGGSTAASINLGVVHLALFAWATLAFSLMGRLEPIPAGMRVGGFVLVAAGAIGILRVFEAHWVTDQWMPIWSQSVIAVLQVAITPIIGIVAAIGLAGSTYDWLSRYWGEYALILIATFAFGMLYVPAGVIACALAAPPLAWLVNRWLRRIRLMDQLGTRVASSLIVAWALLPSLPAILIASVFAG